MKREQIYRASTRRKESHQQLSAAIASNSIRHHIDVLYNARWRGKKHIWISTFSQNTLICLTVFIFIFLVCAIFHSVLARWSLRIHTTFCPFFSILSLWLAVVHLVLFVTFVLVFDIVHCAKMVCVCVWFFVFVVTKNRFLQIYVVLHDSLSIDWHRTENCMYLCVFATPW